MRIKSRPCNLPPSRRSKCSLALQVSTSAKGQLNFRTNLAAWPQLLHALRRVHYQLLCNFLQPGCVCAPLIMHAHLAMKRCFRQCAMHNERLLLGLPPSKLKTFPGGVNHSTANFVRFAPLFNSHNITVSTSRFDLGFLLHYTLSSDCLLSIMNFIHVSFIKILLIHNFMDPNPKYPLFFRKNNNDITA